MDGELRMEAAVERSTITSKPGVETLAQQQSLFGADRGRTKPRKRWVKAALALTFWTGLGDRQPRERLTRRPTAHSQRLTFFWTSRLERVWSGFA
jgi:hypothetical protein